MPDFLAFTRLECGGGARGGVGIYVSVYDLWFFNTPRLPKPKLQSPKQHKSSPHITK